MIYLRPSESVGQALLDASGGTEALEDLHITLAYLGTLGDEIPNDEITRDQIENTVSYVAMRYAALVGEANGWGVFQNDGDVLVSLWNIPGINGFRQALVSELAAIGIPVKANFSYTPHMTVGYYDAESGVSIPSRSETPAKDDFMHVHWTWGAEEQTPVALSGIRREAAAQEDPQEDPQEQQEAQGGASYTLLPKDPAGALEAIQRLIGGASEQEPEGEDEGKRESSLREARDGKEYTRGGNPQNAGQFSKQDQGHRKKTKEPKGKAAPKGKGEGRPQKSGDPKPSQEQRASFGQVGLSRILTDSGFSMDDASGNPPSGGYMLSLNKETERVFDVGSVSIEDIEAYYQEFADLIEGPDKYIGAWVDGDQVYLDVSTNMQGSVEEVLAAAEEAEQLAIWDVAGGQTVYTSLGGENAEAQGQEGDQQPQQGYTGVTYDPEATSFTPEQRKAHGDVYGHFLPEGRYAEGDPRNEPEFEQRMAEKTELTEKYVKVTKEDIENGATEGGQTISLHDEIFDPSTGRTDVYTPERLAVHQEIMAKLSETYASYPREGKAIVMAGPPGAGKSTFLSMYGKDEFGIEVKGKGEPKEDPPAKNFVTLNPDDFKELLPIDASRYPGLEPNELAAMLHEESSHLSKFAVKHFMSQGYNVIIDVTLGNAAKAIRNYVEPYAEQGYDYQVALVDGTMNNSLNNAGLRWKKPDKETGVRTYSGRFLPMHLIESNAPTEGSGYRSKNAEQFTEFMEHDLVSRAIVYDPDTETVAEAKGEGGARDWLNDKSPTEETEEESFEAAAKLVRRALSSILRVKEGARMKRFAKSAPPNGTEITQKIQSYDNGEIDLATLTDWLVNHNYAPGVSSETEAGSAEWYEEVENGTTIPGTFGEVIDAVAFGLLSWEDYATINKAMANSAQR